MPLLRREFTDALTDAQEFAAITGEFTDVQVTFV
jgi:hypothetical protein